MLPRTTTRPASTQNRLRPDEEQGYSFPQGSFARARSLQPRSTPIDITPSYFSPAIPRTTPNHHPQSRTPLDLATNYAPMQRSRAVYTPQPNPPTDKRMDSGAPASSQMYPSPPHEDFHPRQVIRLEYSPRENGQNNYYGSSAASTYVEASYQPPPPVQASYQPPPSPHILRNNARRGLPVPEKAPRAFPAKNTLTTLPLPPSYPPPVPSPTRAISHFLPSPSTSPPQPASPSSPTSTELPDYSCPGSLCFCSDRPASSSSFH